MPNIIKNKNIFYLCVYCGASDNCNPIYSDAAVELGQLIGTQKLGLVYGGGRLGLMGLVANATLSHGGRVVGFIPQHLDGREGAHTGLSELYVVDTMHTRKMNMANYADMFVVMPGGFGTLDEFFEIFTWKQLNLHNKPIVLVNINGYWDTLLALIHHIIDEKFAKEDHRHIFQCVNSVEELIKCVNNYQAQDSKAQIR